MHLQLITVTQFTVQIRSILTLCLLMQCLLELQHLFCIGALRAKRENIRVSACGVRGITIKIGREHIYTYVLLY